MGRKVKLALERLIGIGLPPRRRSNTEERCRSRLTGGIGDSACNGNQSVVVNPQTRQPYTAVVTTAGRAYAKRLKRR